jgi:hypothetical protein
MEDSSPATALATRLEKNLAARGAKLRNKAALGAVVKLIPGVGTALHHALTAGDGAIADERLRLQLDFMTDLLLQIDRAIGEIGDRAAKEGLEWTEVAGTIQVRVSGGKDVAGVRILGESPVNFAQGTVIDVQASNADVVTGLQIGDSPTKGKE